MNKVGLIIIFNHRYDECLPILRELYGKRFSVIRFLMPFYNGCDADVIPVYECSYQFQGYLIQAYKKITELECDSYLFIADDLIISPKINENNFLETLHIGNRSFLMSGISPLNKSDGFEWVHSRNYYKAFQCHGTRWKAQLPSFSEALQKYENFLGSECKLDFDDDFWGKANDIEAGVIENFIKENKGTRILYPLVRGYSDYFWINKDRLFDFARVCGIFSAMNLFVEIALPTAVMLSFERKEVCMLRESDYHENLYWIHDDRQKLETQYHCSLNELLNSWDENLFCIHPIKLSKWCW